MSSWKAGVASFNLVTPAQAAAAKAAAAAAAKAAAAQAAHQAHMQALAHMAANNVLGVTGAKAGAGAVAAKAGAAAGAAGAHTGLSVATAVITPIAVGAAALLVTYGAARLAGAAVDGLVDLADSIERDRARPICSDEADELWISAVTEVTRRNARIAALRGSLGGGAGPDLPLPEPCAVGGSTVERLIAWCRSVDEDLAKLDSVIAAERRRRALRLLRLSQPPELVAAAAVVDVSMSGSSAQSGSGRTAQLMANVDAEILAAMDELPSGAGDQYHADALRMAAKARAAAATGRERAWLVELREKVRQAKRAVEDAHLAAGYLEALDSQDIADEPSGPDTLIERLRAVRDGRSVLGDDLRAWAGQALADLELARERAHVLATTRDVLSDQGFDVDTTSSGAIRGAHRDWRGFYVEFDIDDRMQLSAALRTVHGAREDNPERVTDWRERYAPVEGSLSQAGVSVSLEPAADISISFDATADADEESAKVARKQRKAP
ncbi:hypothetical protein ACIBG8_41600 [Nonomuraea sp. NPDC050556]|uniref:hypothetical protein n=1 Tax=Nonomuraea sp. NPDC050556 TaxID=3364369 RepID=UPI00378E880D